MASGMASSRDRSARRAGLHLAQERALLALDEALLGGECEVVPPGRIGAQPRPVGLVIGQRRERDQAKGNIVGSLVRHPVTDEISAARGDDLEPAARVGLERRGLERIDAITNEDGNCHDGPHG